MCSGRRKACNGDGRECWHGQMASAAGNVACLDPIVGVMCSQNLEVVLGPESSDQIFHSWHLA